MENLKLPWTHYVLSFHPRKTAMKLKKLAVDGEELSDKRNITNSLNEYFTTIASSLLSGHHVRTGIILLGRETQS